MADNSVIVDIMISSYLEIYDRMKPAPLSESNTRKIVAAVYAGFDGLNYADSYLEYMKYSIYCLSLLIALKIKTVDKQKIHDIIISAQCIISHLSGDIGLNDDDTESDDTKPENIINPKSKSRDRSADKIKTKLEQSRSRILKIMELTNGDIYIPSAINIFNVFQQYYSPMLEKDVELVQKVISAILSNPNHLAINQLMIAVGAIQLIQKVKKYKTIFQYKINNVNNDIPGISNISGVSGVLDNISNLSDNISDNILNINLDMIFTLVDKSSVRKEFIPIIQYAIICSDPESIYNDLQAEVKRIYLKSKKSDVQFSTRSSNRSPNDKSNDSLYPSSHLSSLGEGTFGAVIKVVNIYGSTVAYKTQKDNLEAYIKEVALMRSMRHENIQNVLRLNVKEYGFEMPVRNGSLFDKMIKGITISNARSYAKQLFIGITYVHSCGMFHGDLKPANILVTDEGIVKIADFGSSMGFSISNYLFDPEYITYYYRSIEQFPIIKKVPKSGKGKSENPEEKYVDYGPSADIWSCGVILLELFKGYPFKIDGNCPDERDMRKTIILTLKKPDLTANMDKDLALVVKQCLRPQETRATAIECINLIKD